MSQYFPEVAQELVRMLEQEFVAMQAQNDLIKIETKVRNIRFIAELTKFGASPVQLALECLSSLLS